MYTKRVRLRWHAQGIFVFQLLLLLVAVEFSTTIKAVGTNSSTGIAIAIQNNAGKGGSGTLVLKTGNNIVVAKNAINTHHTAGEVPSASEVPTSATLTACHMRRNSLLQWLKATGSAFQNSKHSNLPKGAMCVENPKTDGHDKQAIKPVKKPKLKKSISEDGLLTVLKPPTNENDKTVLDQKITADQLIAPLNDSLNAEKNKSRKNNKKPNSPKGTADEGRLKTAVKLIVDKYKNYKQRNKGKKREQKQNKEEERKQKAELEKLEAERKKKEDEEEGQKKTAVQKIADAFQKMREERKREQEQKREEERRREEEKRRAEEERLEAERKREETQFQQKVQEFTERVRKRKEEASLARSKQIWLQFREKVRNRMMRRFCCAKSLLALSRPGESEQNIGSSNNNNSEKLAGNKDNKLENEEEDGYHCGGSFANYLFEEGAPGGYYPDSFDNGDNDEIASPKAGTGTNIFKKEAIEQQSNSDAAKENQRHYTHKNTPKAQPLGLKGAIRFALRKFLCDSYFDNFNDWHKGNKKNGRTSGDEKLPDTDDKYERDFVRNDPKFPHEFAFDFKFRVYFPNKFKKLMSQFKAEQNQLLFSLTYKELDGFENPAQSDSLFYKSWDRQFFLKSVQLEKKQPVNNSWWLNILNNIVEKFGVEMEALVEKDFFFYMEPNNRKNLDGIENFHNGFEDYIEHVEQMPNTLLPKFYTLFGIQTRDDGGQIKYEHLFFIQNFLFPQGTPRIDYKFDLKGSSKNRYVPEWHLYGNGKEEDISSVNWLDLNFHRVALKDERTKKPIKVPREPAGFFPNGIFINDIQWKETVKQIIADTDFLRDLGILDYSLLLGIHVGKDDSAPGMLATCIRCCKNHPESLANANGGKVDLKIYFGIIDILQVFVTRKKAENFWKERVAPKELFYGAFPNNAKGKQKHPTSTIIPPRDYMDRFDDYIKQVVFHPDSQIAYVKENSKEISDSKDQLRLLGRVSHQDNNS